MRTLLLTGASSGIGLATAEKLLDQGYRVIGIARAVQRAPFNTSNFIPISLDL
ncbi:MAG: SDR family NAD(P)-dependent oxidoreductase, partial [Nitrospiria bacterium]